MKRIIDLNYWPRKNHYLFFKDFEIPRFNMTFPLDVTQLYGYAKRHQFKFFYTLMHYVIQSMNTIENFGYRIEGDQVWHQPIEYVSFTDVIQETDLFKMVFVEVHPNLTQFQQDAIAASLAQGSNLIRMEKEAILNTVYITSFPWARFNHFSHATKLGSTDSVPRVSWSQFVEEQGKKILTMSIEVHHGLVDGYHVGQWIQSLQNLIEHLND
jgi:chloramphenicol O-acetyltransferase type A